MYRLDDVVDTLLVLQKKHRIRFDIWQVVKRDHAIISFFDQVFDQGLNPVVPWTAYWTPLRYPLLLNLAILLMKSWLKRHGVPVLRHMMNVLPAYSMRCVVSCFSAFTF